MNYKFVPITPKMLAAASERDTWGSQRYGNLNTRLTGKPEHRMNGYLGEQIVHVSYPELEFNWDDDKYDFRLGDVYFDVKGTGCTYTPRPGDTATHFKESTIADYFIFTRVLKDRTGGWVVAFIRSDTFYEIAEFIKAGTVNQNFVYEHDRFGLKYNQMMYPPPTCRGLPKITKSTQGRLF